MTSLKDTALLRRYTGLTRRAFEISGAGLVVQGLGAITTLSFVRFLKVDQYATLALCISAIGFIAVASDIGLTASISYFWREAQRGNADFAERFAAIRRVRTILFLITGTFSVFALAIAVKRQDIDAESAFFVIALVLAISFMQLNAAMSLVVFRLSHLNRLAYSAEISGAFIRVLFTILLLSVFTEAWAALLCMAIGSLTTLIFIFCIKPPALENRTLDISDYKVVFRYIMPTMPYVLLFASQDSIIYWCAIFRGGNLVLAQTFALGRVSAIFIILSTVMANFVMPIVVNSDNDRQALRTSLLSITAVTTVCIILIAVAYVLPNAFLVLLGSNYSGLQFELILALSAASLHLIAQSLNSTTRVLGWTRLEPVMTVIQALVLVAGALSLPLISTRQVLIFSNILAGSFLVLNFMNLLWNGRSLRFRAA